jgi:hypothetical protein
MSTHVKTGTPAYDKAGNKVRAVLGDESEVAHVWTTGEQDHGRFRAIYFDGPTLYSYGSHYVIGRMMDDGVALLNAESNSMTTTGHRRSADYATSHLTRYFIPDLTGALRILDRMNGAKEQIKRMKLLRAADSPDKEWHESNREWAEKNAKESKAAGRAFMVANAEGFTDDAAALYMLKLFGYPAASWPAIKREAERNRLREEESRRRHEKARALADAKVLADASDSDFAGMYPPDQGRYGDGGTEALEEFRKRLWRAHRTAKGAGWPGRTRKLWKRLGEFKAHLEGRIARIHVAQLAALRTEFADWRGGGEEPRTYYGIEERFPELAEDFAELAAYRDAKEKEEHAALFAKWKDGQGRRPPLNFYDEGSPEHAAILADEGRDAERWQSGEHSHGRFSDPKGGALLRINGDPAAPDSAELETSHGARVPLSHAIKAFRFVKLIREKGGHWQRNGRTVRVGHYQLDSIDPDGFNAGCHRINWPEIARVAKLAGVFDCPASDAAESVKESA